MLDHHHHPIYPVLYTILGDTHMKLVNYTDPGTEWRTVTISPGVTTGELMTFFLQNNVCFESDVILPNVTYGGILTGGCHVRTFEY